MKSTQGESAGTQGESGGDSSYKRFDEPLPRVLNVIVDAPPLDRISRLDIYAEGYFARFIEVLSDDFEHLQRALTVIFGDMAFHKIISSYLSAYPSHTRTICDVGQHLPDFLKQHPPLKEFPYLAEIAHMDWCATRALYIDALSAFDTSSLSGLDEDGWACLQFELDPTVQLLTVGHSIERIWNQTDFDPARIEALETNLLIFRTGELVQVERIEALAFLVLSRMQEGKSLGEICEEIDSLIQNDEAPPIMEWFSQWVASGVVRRASPRL